MAIPDKDFIVAIELGSSHISAIAGKKKDGTMQILAYAEEKNNAYVKRGVVYNIEKTYQCINSLLSKLESTLKSKICYVYVGIEGQSLRSYRSIVKRDLITQSIITGNTIDTIRDESREIPFSDYKVLDNIPQEYIVDQKSIADPVGVQATNIDGEFLNIIAKNKLTGNISTVFEHTDVKVIGEVITPLALADNILSETEKRSGCVLVDLGADTTTVLVYKKDILRYLATIPLGMNNINRDLSTLQIDEAEAEKIKLRYADLSNSEDDTDDKDENLTHTTADGVKLDIATIKNVIKARATEIIDNVRNQILLSNYNADNLLAGIILTGGGANMPGIDKAFISCTSIDKCRIARTITPSIVKTSNAAGYTSDNCMTNGLTSILLSGTLPCGSDSEYEPQDIFSSAQANEERQARLKQQKEEADREKAMLDTFDQVKTAIRDEYAKVQRTINEVTKYGKDKDVRKSARDISINALSVLGDNYKDAASPLENKEKYKQTLREGEELAQKLHDAVDELTEAVNKADDDNKWTTRLFKILNDLATE